MVKTQTYVCEYQYYFSSILFLAFDWLSFLGICNVFLGFEQQTLTKHFLGKIINIAANNPHKNYGSVNASYFRSQFCKVLGYWWEAWTTETRRDKVRGKGEESRRERKGVAHFLLS